MKKNVSLIISGGDLDLEFLKTFIKNKKIDYIIAVDAGLEKLDSIKLLPNYIIGDFDSIKTNILKNYEGKDIEIIRLNPEKDFSDTHMALKLAIELKSNEVYILAALGKRIDHAIANIHILKEALEKNIKCKIIDNKNEIQLITKGVNNIKKLHYKYISLFPLTTQVKGITLEGFKYPLNNAVLNIGHSIGVSNEIINNDAKIYINDGILLVIKSND